MALKPRTTDKITHVLTFKFFNRIILICSKFQLLINSFSDNDPLALVVSFYLYWNTDLSQRCCFHRGFQMKGKKIFCDSNSGRFQSAALHLSNKLYIYYTVICISRDAFLTLSLTNHWHVNYGIFQFCLDPDYIAVVFKISINFSEMKPEKWYMCQQVIHA